VSDFEEMARELNQVADGLQPYQHQRLQVPAKIPLELAIKEVAAKTGVPEHRIRHYAEEMRRQSAGLPTVAGIGPAIKAAADFELAARQLAQTMSQPVETVRKQMLEMATASPRPPADQCPAMPANRRTFHLFGKPKHYVQVGGQLRLVDGESPWT
jgi:hypothetical protein